MSQEYPHHHYHISYKKPGTDDLMVKINKIRAGVRRITEQLRKLGYSYSVKGCDDKKCGDYLTVYGSQREQTNGEATDSDRGRND